jgi:hypothetical protein
MNDFNEQYSAELDDWLTYYVRSHFQDVSREATTQKDKLLVGLADSLGSDEYIKFKASHHNNHLHDQVTNRLEVIKYLEINGRLVQKDDPIYLIPESNIGRAHFYAPIKKFNKQYTDTKWFNLMVLWGFNFIVYITLLLDLFRKFISYMNSLKLRRESG